MKITDAAPGAEALSLFHRGTYDHSYQIFGAHPVSGGVRFTLWCPGAVTASVVGDFSGWEPLPLLAQGDSGVFSAILPQAKVGDRYMYRITAGNGETYDKADPYAFSAEIRPGTASRVASFSEMPRSDDAFSTSNI